MKQSEIQVGKTYKVSNRTPIKVLGIDELESDYDYHDCVVFLNKGEYTVMWLSDFAAWAIEEVGE